MKTLLDWRHQYDTARDKKEGDLAGLECKDESLTQQHFTDDANINVLAERFGMTGIPAMPLDPAMFRDTTNDPDLRQILDQNIEARNYFNALPHKLRQRFHHSMGELWNFLLDPENAEEAVRLGLLTRPTPAGDAQRAPADSPAATQNANAGEIANTPSPTTRDGSSSNTEGVPKPPRTP